MAEHAKSFRFAALFLPREGRQRAAVTYAFCRLVDDLADEADDPVAGAAELARLDAELAGEAPPRPLVEAFVGAGAGPHTREAARELIRGVRGDLGAVRVADDRELMRYCYRVAGTVGLMMLPVLGVRAHSAAAHAIDLGIGMQLTNICRDVREDAEMGRVYLPGTRLRAAGTDGAALLAGRAERGAVARVVRGLLDLAERYYASADAGMRAIPWRSRLAIHVARHVYHAIGTKLRRRGGDALAGRAMVHAHEKRRIAARGLLSGLGLAFARRRPHEPQLHEALRGLPGANPLRYARRGEG